MDFALLCNVIHVLLVITQLFFHFISFSFFPPTKKLDWSGTCSVDSYNRSFLLRRSFLKNFFSNSTLKAKKKQNRQGNRDGNLFFGCMGNEHSHIPLVLAVDRVDDRIRCFLHVLGHFHFWVWFRVAFSSRNNEQVSISNSRGVERKLMRPIIVQ